MCVRAAPHIGAPPLAIARQSIEPGKKLVAAAVMDGSGRGAAKKTRALKSKSRAQLATRGSREAAATNNTLHTCTVLVQISTQDRTHANKPQNEHTNADTKAHMKAHTSTDQPTTVLVRP